MWMMSLQSNTHVSKLFPDFFPERTLKEPENRIFEPEVKQTLSAS